MSLKEIILQLIQIALFFAFPTIWNWLIKLLPWWPLDPESTLNIIIYLVVIAVSWLLGYVGIKRFVRQLKAKGFVAETQS